MSKESDNSLIVVCVDQIELDLREIVKKLESQNNLLSLQVYTLSWLIDNQKARGSVQNTLMDMTKKQK